jgi:hypothetical protein
MKATQVERFLFILHPSSFIPHLSLLALSPDARYHLRLTKAFSQAARFG